MIDNLLTTMPLWLAGLLLVMLCLLAAEAGRFVHRRLLTRAGGPSGSATSELEGYIIGAIFGLFAFIIAITFSIALDRFDGRRGWVAEEATAINTAFLRAELFEEPYRTRLQVTLRDYARTRIAPEGLWNKRMEAQVAQSRQLRPRLWSEARAAIYPVRDTDLGASFAEVMSDVLNIGIRRELAGTAHIPNRILNALLLYLLVASGALGYLSGGQPRPQRLSSALLFALFVTAIVLILDLDRPRAGTIQVSQQPLEDLVASLDKTRLPESVQPASQ